jgi:hypothetical protein
VRLAVFAKPFNYNKKYTYALTAVREIQRKENSTISCCSLFYFYLLCTVVRWLARVLRDGSLPSIRALEEGEVESGGEGGE